MRILCTAWGWATHVQPMLPLARALAEAGHEVLFALPPEVSAISVAAGLPTTATSGHRDPLPIFRTIAHNPPPPSPTFLSTPSRASSSAPTPASPAASSPVVPPAFPPTPSPVFPSASPLGSSSGGGRMPRVLGLLVALAEDMAGDLVGIAREFRPELVLYDPTALAGPVAAAAVGARAVRHLYGLDLLAQAAPLLNRELEPLYHCLRLPPLTGPTTAVDPWPGPTHPNHLPIRHTTYGVDAGLSSAALAYGTEARPSSAAAARSTEAGTSYAVSVYGAEARASFPRSGSRRRWRVCVSWGHTLARLDGELHLAGRVARAVAADPSVEVVVVAAPEHRELLGELPPGVQVAGEEPLGVVVAGCDALISQGGAGVSLTGLALGVPQLMIAVLPDHLAHARAVAALGAGRVLAARDVFHDTPPDAAAETVRRELRLLLDTPDHRKAATETAHHIRTRPSPQDVAATLTTPHTPPRTA